MTHVHMQEREKRQDEWVPRWFKATPGASVFECEFPEDKCPLWEFTGEYLKRPKRSAKPDGEDVPPDLTSYGIVTQTLH